MMKQSLGCAAACLALLGAAPAARAEGESLGMPVTRAQRDEIITGKLTEASGKLRYKDESRPAVVLQFQPLMAAETYHFAIKATRGEIRVKTYREESKPGKPVKLTEIPLQSNKHKTEERALGGASTFFKDYPVRLEIMSSGPEREAEFKFVLTRPNRLGPSLKTDREVRALLDLPAAREIDTRADRPNDTTPWNDKAAVPPIVHTTVPAPPTVWLDAKPVSLRPFYAALYQDGEHSAVVNFERLGLAAMELDLLKDAAWAFDRALERIEAVYADNPVAKAARSRYTLEAIKEFKGEPYERAMAYYYRGLLHLMTGDYEDARATFRAAEYQDTVSEDEQFAGDFALMNFLAGWSARCMGQAGSAAEDFKEAAAIDSALVEPPSDRSLLLIGEIGHSPVKTKRGGSNELLVFARSQDQGRDEAAQVRLGQSGAPIALRDAGDIHFQATTRGGRPIDALLGGKAVAKKNLANAADLIGASVELGLLGLIPQLLSDKIAPDTDIRMWDTLPDRIVLATANGNTDQADFNFTPGSTPIEAVQPVQHSAGRCGIAWSRSRSAARVEAGAPGNDENSRAARAKSVEGVKRDISFRTWLTTEG